MISRRAFVASLTGGLIAAPLAAGAQQAGRVPRIGYLSFNPRPDTRHAMDGFRAKLRDLGYIDGQNLLIEYRYADGNYERLPTLATELVRLKASQSRRRCWGGPTR